MKPAVPYCSLVVAMLGVAAMVAAPAVAAEMPNPPKISTFAPADDLVGQLQAYVEEVEESVETEQEYGDSKEKLLKDADTVLLIGLALGLHDQPNPYQRAAPGIVEAAKEVSAAENFDAAKAAVGALKAALTSNADASKLSWQDAQAASLKALMEQVPLINTKMKRYLRGSRFKTKADETAGHAAVLAIIAQGSMPLADKTDKPAEAEKWFAYCEQMRDAANKLRSTIRAQDEDAADQAVQDLTQSCDDCHAVFHPE
ncbi:MAG: hypothetical protein GXY83_37465 [Rhodopirellula sp.]|nr:hypothetical protein [Rhodopirellula sp.]